MVGTSSAPSSLKEYLKKYTSNDDVEKKKKKKTKKKAKPDSTGVLVVDEDPIWQKPVKIDEEDDSADEEKPQVNEDIEVKRMRRLEELRAKRPYGAISDDGSGWISVSNTPTTINSESQNTDISPPRKRRLRNDAPSPEPEQQSELPADDDLSPPRQSRKHHRISPESEIRRSRAARYDTPSPEPYPQALESDRVVDLSPPRRQRQDKAVDSDISPLRRDSRYRDDSRASSAADLSPPRKSKNERSGSTVSARKSTHNLDDRDTPSVSDLSPPRRKRKESHPRKTGLVTGEDIKDEILTKKKEDLLRFSQMDPSVSGRNAEPIYRNKITGERMSKEEFLKSQKKKKEEKPKEIKLEWGKGLAQKREAETRLQEIEAEKDKPFARSRDDPELDAMLKAKVRFGDPMAHLVENKQSEHMLPNLADSERMKESGFIIPQEVPTHSWMKRGLEAAPNRYGIKPGRHWDGVDRSNGYEKEMFKRTNEKRATEREAYLWSVSDM